MCCIFNIFNFCLFISIFAMKNMKTLITIFFLPTNILSYYYFLKCQPFCLCRKTWTSKRGRIYFALNSRSSWCGVCCGEEMNSPQDGSQDQGRREGGKEEECKEVGQGYFSVPPAYMGHSLQPSPPYVPIIPSRSTLVDTARSGAFS